MGLVPDQGSWGAHPSPDRRPRFGGVPFAPPVTGETLPQTRHIRVRRGFR